MLGTIPFDESAADRLIKAATGADITLLFAASARRSAAEDASTDFSGAYADRFAEAAVAEAADRVRLAGALGRLADAVQVVIGEAQRERERLADVDAWQGRETARQQAEDEPLGIFEVKPTPMFDPKPSDVPIRPTPISASFSASDRPRTAGGSSTGRSSADPERLRTFVASARASDRGFSEHAGKLRTAWSGFTSTCSWAEVSSSTLLPGFDRYLQENASDADWIERIASAFDRAGGEGLSNTVLDFAAAATIPPSFQTLLTPGATPAEVAATWAGLGLTNANEADLQALPLEVLAMLGNLEGIPYWARNTANQEVLDDRLARKNLDPDEREALRSIRASLGENRFLISLTGDVPPLAAVSIGDLDTATNVTWAVPGMGSSTKTMTGWVQAAQNVADEQVKVDGPGNRAVIAWMGYEAPPAPPDLGVFNEDAAENGGAKLAESIRGLDAVRAGDMPRTNVLAHSYGTTTASIGLTAPGVHVDSFTSIASAGIPQTIPTAQDIQADHVYAGQAQDTFVGIPGLGDQYAYIGRGFSVPYRLDPTNSSFGAETFGADGADGFEPVQDHGVHTDKGNGYLDPGTESLRNVAKTTTGHGDRVTPAG